ncbi:hypothetical protein B296_00042633 [Ensete ventricosum]|uniref:Uncharacterized protein n=1 Tax=Ensete ventricosum TaxID=4639 RepID=A0A426YRU7_ENSVE|nr:hypothetical protein B296_00042633 [Ensete ventricosum]
MNLLGMKKAVVTRDSHPETSRPATEPAVKKLVSVKVLPPLKRLKKLGDSLVPASKPKPASEVLRGEGSSRKKDKGVARPRSIRDLCRVKAWVPDEPYMAREIVELLELVGDSPLKVRWASLTPRHKVWADGADAQVFCRGVSASHSPRRYTPHLSSRDNEVTAKMDEVQRGEAEALEKVKALEKELQGLKGDLEAAKVKNRETKEFLSVAWAMRKKAEKDLAAS